MDLSSLSIANSIDPFTLEDINELGNDRLILSNGTLTLCVSGNSFLQFIKTEMDNGKGLEDMQLGFDDGEPLELSCDIWASCFIAEDNYAVELMGLISMIHRSKIDYHDRLALIEHEVMCRIKIFVHDLLVFGKDKGAQKRLESNLGSLFYMSEVYFSIDQVNTILAFQGKNGLTLKNVLEGAFDKKVGEMCAAHTLAPILQRHFSIPKGFRSQLQHKKLYQKFCKLKRGAS